MVDISPIKSYDVWKTKYPSWSYPSFKTFRYSNRKVKIKRILKNINDIKAGNT